MMRGRMIRSKFVGSLLGLAVGDSLGARSEGQSVVEAVEETFYSYTDDTAMMIGVAESLIACRGVQGEHMGRKFLEHYEREPWRGYGSGPPRIFALIRQGARWDERLDRRFYPGGSFGNGAAMRVAPIGLFYYKDPIALRKAAYASSMLTHSHPLAMEGAALQAYAVALAVREEKDFLNALLNFTTDRLYRERIESIKRLVPEKQNIRTIVKELGNGIEAFNSVPAAIYAFLVSSSFRESILYSIRLGGDTDTIAAMCGAIAGAFWGAESIPPHWKEQLEQRDYIENLAHQLFEHLG